MPNVKNLDKLPRQFEPIEDPEWAADDLANVDSGVMRKQAHLAGSAACGG